MEGLSKLLTYRPIITHFSFYESYGFEVPNLFLDCLFCFVVSSCRSLRIPSLHVVKHSIEKNRFNFTSTWVVVVESVVIVNLELLEEKLLDFSVT